MASIQRVPDAEAIKDHERQYGHGPTTEEELDSRYPHRPRNFSKTLPFHDLFMSLFDPLLDNVKRKAAGSRTARAKQGPHGPVKLSPLEMKHNIIQRFISRWRSDVGPDFYPALRLILPDKDRDRPMYGLKERAIGKLLVKLLKINSKSEDALNLLNWKLPSQTIASRMAGDFPGRCHEVLSKRSMRSEVGDMRIAEVNELLDKLAAAQKEDEQLPIFTEFYNRMNANELTWLIRIILRQMKMGATERSFFHIWHPDADALFNVSSSLRRVCWELWDPTKGLEADHAGITLMSCFQPQLAQFQTRTFDKMVERLGVTDVDPEFWIEEKLDGERMQLHMTEDDDVPGRKRFGFWSRKGKDYTYLYGSGFEDVSSALTQHIKDAFTSGVRNIILDGEMITWDPEADIMVPFGTLKTAALSEQRNPFAGTGIRPLFRVFDCLYLNDKDITNYTLRDRREALEKAIQDVPRRIEVHKYTKTVNVRDIEPALRKVVAEASEGLVLKNPRSVYQLNSRNDDWVKVKPEYMSEFGENLDCLIIGGYYGTGHRGGYLSSFMCGLRVNQNDIDGGANPMKFYSFFKVGGGFRAEDYAAVKHHTDGKWVDWDHKNPPTEYIDIGGPDGQSERPDVWIKPSDSVVLEVKAASIIDTDSFATRYSLRFPRFKRLRTDKDWQSALSTDDFMVLKARAEAEAKEKEMTVETSRKRMTKRLKKEKVIAGNDSKITNLYAGPKTEVFEGLNFFVLSEMLHPHKKSKAEIEQIIKSNGGNIFQSSTAKEDIICIGDKKVIKVASLIKSGHTNIVKPAWVMNVLRQAEIDGPQRQRLLVPFEPNQMFHMTQEAMEGIQQNVDPYGDSYARDVTKNELESILGDMIHPKNSNFSPDEFVAQLEEHGTGFGETLGSMFRGCVARFAPADENLQEDSELELDLRIVRSQFKFACGTVAEDDDDEGITHFVVTDETSSRAKRLRGIIAGSARTRLPRIVTLKWLQDSWTEKTLLDEERYAVV